MKTGEAEYRPGMRYDEVSQRTLLRVADEGFWEWNLVTDQFWLNPSLSRLTGLSTSEMVLDIEAFTSIIHPDDRELFFDNLHSGSANTPITTLSLFRLLSRNGNTYWLESKSKAVDFDNEGNVLRIIGHVTDITDRRIAEEQLKKLNRALLAISKGNQALLRANNEKGLLDDICKIIVEVGGYLMAWVGYAEDDPDKSVRVVANAGLDEGYLDSVSVTWNDCERGRGPTGTAIRTGVTCVVHDMKTDRKFEPWRLAALERGYASALACPLKNGHRIFGALTIYSATPDAFDAEESELLSSLAENLAYGITIQQNRRAREQAEEELRQSEERYRRLFQNQQVTMLIIDPQSGEIVDANPAAVSFYGWSHNELCRMNINEINTLSPEEIIAEIQKARQLNYLRFSFRHRLASGAIRDVEVVSGPISIEGRSLLYSIITDVTDRKHAEEQLIEGNQRMHYILAAVNAGIWEYDLQTKVTVWSDELWKLCGIQPASRTPPSFDSMVETCIPEDRERLRSAWYRALFSGSDFNAMWRVEFPEGSIRWLMTKGSPVRKPDGKVSCYMGIILDISERKQEEEEKLQLESQLRQAQRLETIGTLAGGIAHDFNNILTPILGYAEMGLLAESDAKAGQEYFREIMQAADRARNLVSQILTFSRSQEITPSMVSVPSVIDEALKLLRPSLPALIRIEKEIDRSCGNILADPSQIHQVIVNLCTNAYQAMGDGLGTIRIALEAVVPDNELLKSLPEPHAGKYIQLTIADTGIGMDDATMERIFEPFFTTKSPRQGTGLGLSVVHGIVSGYNGLITVHSKQGQGTAFRVYLPIVEGTADQGDPETIPTTGNASIMFIDDESASTRMMTTMLTKLGFRIKAFNSPLEALDCFRQDPGQFDLVITDLTMPEMSGVDLASEVHATKPELPIILMTGYGKDLENIKALSQHGIRKFMKKPVRMAELSSTINEVITG